MYTYLLSERSYDVSRVAYILTIGHDGMTKRRTYGTHI